MSKHRYPSMTPAEQAEQARHDTRHPGKICQYCPVNVASQRRLMRRPTWWDMWVFPLVVLLVAIPIMWAVASLIGWWRP